jgi:hypothetical protein
MDSAIENSENKEELVSEQLDVTPEAFSEEKTADESEVASENAGEKGTFSTQSNPEVNVDTKENEEAEGNIDNTSKEGVEIVEIEEKVIIETLDEAKSTEDSTLAGDLLESVGNDTNLTSTEDTESQPSTSETNSSPSEPPEQTKQPEFIDLLGNGLLKKKVSVWKCTSCMMQ